MFAFIWAKYIIKADLYFTKERYWQMAGHGHGLADLMPHAVDRQMFAYWLRHAPEVQVKDGSLLFPEEGADKLVLFNVPFPVEEAEVGACLAMLLSGGVIDREVIRNFAANDELRSEFFGKLSPSTQTELRRDGDVMRQLARLGLQVHDEKLRREVRMAYLALGLGISGEKYVVSWGAGTNILFPEATRFYFDFSQADLAKIYPSVKPVEIAEKNREKERWYRVNFKRSRSDIVTYSTIHRQIPERITTSAELNVYLATFMYNVVKMD